MYFYWPVDSSTPPNSKTGSICGSPPNTNGPQGIISGLGMGSSQEGAPIHEVLCKSVNFYLTKIYRIRAICLDIMPIHLPFTHLPT